MSIDNTTAECLCIVMADDSQADRSIVRRVLDDSEIVCHFHEVEDGIELIEYLTRKPPFDNVLAYPRPDIVLMDINMPRLNGKAALELVRESPDGRYLPIVILTTSTRDIDVVESYSLGANAYIAKPMQAQDFIDTINKLQEFWFKFVMLPKSWN